jgi:DNA-binding transcriptional MerR regulator
MTKHKAIPEGYMTVGELAKKMNTTVRALQHYDREGVLSPSAESEGGRRLYNDRDTVRLHQIQSMKSLGFSLSDIKNRLVSLDTPREVADALAGQAEAIRKNIASLTETLDTVEKLREETLLMQTVDFTKYAAIVVNLQMKNEFYGVVKHFDDKMMTYFHSRFTVESATAVLNNLSRLIDKIGELQKRGIPPESGQGQALAKDWWDLVTEVTRGDMSLLPELVKLPELMKSGGNKEPGGAWWNEKWASIAPYLNQALAEYFTKLGVNPFEEAKL